MRRHFLLLLAISCLGLLACRGSRSRICPEGMSLDDKHSKPAQFAWCRNRDSKRAQYIEFQPGGKEKRQTCDFRDGRAEGRFVAWFPNGKVWIAGQFAAGHPQGRWSQWDKSGAMAAEGEYRDGRFVAGAPVASSAVCDKLHPP